MPSGRVLIIDNDRDVAEVVRAILTDEGYEVSVLSSTSPDAVIAAIGRLEPDAVLLDGASEVVGYGDSWLAAARVAARERRVPVIMFTAHSADLDEGRARETERSRSAGFAAVVPKPFELEMLVDAVAGAVQSATPFDGSVVADQGRSAQLASELEAVGARDVRMSTRREWVTFRTRRDELMQVYWWQAGGSYLVGCYEGDGRQLKNIALTYDRASAVEICAAHMSREDDAAA